MRKTFKDIRIGETFVWAGWYCVKQGENTARRIMTDLLLHIHPDAHITR